MSEGDDADAFRVQTSSRARRRELSRQLDELMVELAYAGMNSDQPLVMALLEARERCGSRRIVLEDAQQQRLSWQALFTRAFILAELLAESSPRPQAGEGPGVRAHHSPRPQAGEGLGGEGAKCNVMPIKNNAF